VMRACSHSIFLHVRICEGIVTERQKTLKVAGVNTTKLPCQHHSNVRVDACVSCKMHLRARGCSCRALNDNQRCSCQHQKIAMLGSGERLMTLFVNRMFALLRMTQLEGSVGYIACKFHLSTRLESKCGIVV